MRRLRLSKKHVPIRLRDPRRIRRLLGKSILLAGVLLTLAFVSSAQVSVLTQHNDNSRTGQNLNETILTPSNVNPAQFGKLFSLAVDAQVYAQPLYVPGIIVNGTPHNVLIVATENESVYAFDADSNTGANAKPLWMASLVDAAHGAGPNEQALNSDATIGCTDLQPKIGITSTPVIDPVSHTIYVEAKSWDGGSDYFHRLHALDLFTGKEKSPGPVLITATVPGMGQGSSRGKITFNPFYQHNRPGLLLVNGTLYVGFASHCDITPYHGWLFAYNKSTLASEGVWVTTPNGGLGGVWMAGSGLASDANGNVFLATGNGSFENSRPPLEYGDSIVKLATANGNLSVLDYFTPQVQAMLAQTDSDLGSGGVLLLPDQPGPNPHLLVESGKQGRIYLVDRDMMTLDNEHYCKTCRKGDAEIVQESVNGEVGGMWSMPAYWNGNVYFIGSGDVLKSIPLSNGLLDYAHVTSGADTYGFPGATPSISANGATNGIVWAIDSSNYGSPGPGPGPAVLHAYDATNVASEIYNSTMASGSRDKAHDAVKFSVPTIANGKVYFGATNFVDVYGLLAN
jgi:hypothetical protein